MQGTSENTAKSVLFSIFLLLIAMLSIQSGASLAKSLFPYLGAAGTTTLRLIFSALILLIIFRPWRKKISLQSWKSIALYGVALGVMNLTFYMAILTIPLGVAVALEFSGPLLIAMMASRRLVDFLWVGLAVVGLLMLLPLGSIHSNLDWAGVFWALAAGGCWALYIVFGKKAGSVSGTLSVSLGSCIAALVVLPFGIVSAGTELLNWSLLPLALLVGVFASALPYSLEIVALTRLPSQTFGILMSIEPAMGALSGYIFLHEALSFMQWIALVCIITASAGAALTIKKS